MDLIDRQAAIDALARTAREKFNLSDEFSHYLAGLMDGEMAIRQLQSAQPELPIKEKCCYCPHCTNCDVNDDLTINQPERKGKWLFVEYPDGYYHTECSECGQWCDEDVFLKGKWRYCPNCGSHNGGEDHETD